MQLQDRSGGSPEYLAEQTTRFIEAARKRPEIGRISTLYRATVPQIYADIDRSKVLKAGVPLNDVNTTLGALLGSSYVNDFNRFGRVYKVYVQAEPEYRRDPSQLGLFFVRNQQGGMVPLDTLVTTTPSAGPEFTNRFNLFRAAEVTGVPAPGFSSTQALDALEADGAGGAAARHELRLGGHVVPGTASARRRGGVHARHLPGVPDPRGAVPELGTAVQRAARNAVCGVRRVPRPLAGPPVPRSELCEQRLRADRADHADRPRGEERDPDRRVREDGARQGQGADGSRHPGGEAALPSDPDDRLRLHPRRRPAAHGVGRRRRRRAR